MNLSLKMEMMTVACIWGCIDELATSNSPAAVRGGDERGVGGGTRRSNLTGR